MAPGAQAGPPLALADVLTAGPGDRDGFARGVAGAVWGDGDGDGAADMAGGGV